MALFNENSNGISSSSYSPFAALGLFIPSQLTSVLGSFLDNQKDQNSIEIRDVQLQTSTYGRIIPEIFGKVRISGNIIWASDIIKEKTYGEYVKDKFGNVVGQKDGSVNFKVSLAIAICKGVVDDIQNIYADEILLNKNSLDLMIYYGTEDQLPNSVIQIHEGSENTPAFRGLCYVVVNNFSLNNYNGRIPNFTFDVTRCTLNDSSKKINQIINGINIIPGTGEFAYDTVIQYKSEPIYYLGSYVGENKSSQINHNNNTDKSDSIASFEQLKKSLPNLKWTSLVSCWFGDNLDANLCNIEPKVELHEITTAPNEWMVGSLVRNNAKLISRDEKNNLRYGGTPSDLSILRYCKYIKQSGMKMCFYPMIMMDIEGKPWRGQITCNADEINNFFTKSGGYNEFILHYANLLKGKIDAFIIGSELIGLTKIRASDNSFPAVDELCNLAIQVKQILGDDVIITYAADWSEYHHTDGGWYNLDKLWSCDAIDVIGIDAYFPLTDSSQSVYDIEEVKNGWESGEGYEFCYSDQERMQKIFFDMNDPLSARWGWKNIKNWWENEHFNPDGQKSNWIPKSKEIWFTEYGFPSVDCCTNQPNIFYSENSINSGFPRKSNGEIDFRAQRIAIQATEEKWKDSEMITQKFLWTWDARPYPYFPNLLNIWLDSESWKYGHWINGKITFNTLGEIISYLCKKSGLLENDFDSSKLDQNVEGFILNQKTTPIEIILMLSKVYNFDIYLSSGKIVFGQNLNDSLIEINKDDVLIKAGEVSSEKSKIELNLETGKIELLFINSKNYKISSTNSSINENNNITSFKLPIVLSSEEAADIASNLLLNSILDRKKLCISLSFKYINLKIGDILKLEEKYYKIFALSISNQQFINLILIENAQLRQTKKTYINTSLNQKQKIIPETEIFCFQIPNIKKEYNQKPKIICSLNSSKSNWKGCEIYYKIEDGEFIFYKTIHNESIKGKIIKNLNNNSTEEIIDSQSSLIVFFNSNDEVCFEKNEKIALVGNEIVSFEKMENISDGIFKFSNFKRGISDSIQNNHTNSENFILLDENILEIEFPISCIGKNISIAAVSFGQDLSSASIQKINLNKISILKRKVVNLNSYKQKNGDIILNWKNRSSTDLDFLDYFQKSEIYCVNIFNENKSEILESYSNIKDEFLKITKEKQLEIFKKEIFNINFDILLI